MTPLLLALNSLWVVALAAAEASPTPPVDSTKLPPPAERKISFEQDVQPLLKRSCWGCHSAEAWESGLRLDRRDKALAGGDGGKAIVVGKSAESRLIHFVGGAVADKVMPPDGEPLTPEEIGILRAWIDQGLDWPTSPGAEDPARRHWAFQSIQEPTMPEGTAGHPIDRFIAAKLSAQGISPSKPAERNALIRRLSLDLLGLLPAPDDVTEFVADDRPDAYERLVDRLLASPHFGERWGRHWLDLARYADSDGYEKDLPRPFAYRYRDWVIGAFNADLPFDQFTVEQLAGDLAPNAGLDQRLATGFHRQTLTNREGGIDPREDRDKQLVDRTNTTGAVWMGLTLGCAQCHTHKYDPISQREYYQLYAFFNAAQEQEIPAATEWEGQRYATLQAAHNLQRQPLVDAINDYRETMLPRQLAAWEQRLKDEPIAWTPWESTEARAESPAELRRQPDGSWLATGVVPDVDAYTLTLPIGRQRPTGLLLEMLPQAELPNQGPGRAPNGNYVLTEVKVAWQTIEPRKSKPQAVRIASAQADYVQNAGTPKAFTPAGTFDNDPKTGWAVGGAIGQPHALLVELDGNTLPPADQDVILSVTLEQRYGGQHLLGSFRLLTTTAARPLTLPQASSDIADILTISPDQRTDAHRSKLLHHYAAIDPGLLDLTAKLKAVDDAGPPPPITKGMVFVQSDQPPQTHIHQRGDFLSPGMAVEPAVLEILNPLESSSATPNRLDLARWLVSEAHPLTRRVAVNRIWQQLFGRGIVDPPDDFGLRGAPPTHPELLDWLSVEFSTRNWSVKELIRLIVTSDTYQRSSAGRPDLAEIDPKNLWLARQNRFRLTGEILRDLTLQVSGLLDDCISGPSIRPPLPAGVADLGYAGSVKWAESQGVDRYRRGCYIFFQRTVPYPLLMTFDGPDSNVTCQRRERSNTPLQSLTLLNDPAFVECARVLGREMSKDPNTSPSDRLRTLTIRTLGRDATDDELGVLASLFAAARDRFRDHPEEATALGDADAASVEDAAWVSLARVMLNLDEFVTRE